MNLYPLFLLLPERNWTIKLYRACANLSAFLSGRNHKGEKQLPLEVNENGLPGSCFQKLKTHYMKSNFFLSGFCLDEKNRNTFYRRDAETRGKYLCASAPLRLLYSLLETQRRPIRDLEVKR